MKKFFAKHRKIKDDINNKRFPVRDISVNFRFGLHFLPITLKQHVRKLLDNHSTVTRFTTSVTYPVEI
jgi:hypothetical protein